MSNKLTRDEILREMLATILKGWGQEATHRVLDELETKSKFEGLSKKPSGKKVRVEHNAVKLVSELHIEKDRKELLLHLANEYESGSVFSKLSDVQAFLALHNHNTKDLRSREQAFRKVIPILQRMSEKGLLTLISRARHSGPAELGSISDAIKDAGQSMRGSIQDNKNSSD